MTEYEKALPMAYQVYYNLYGKPKTHAEYANGFNVRDKIVQAIIQSAKSLKAYDNQRNNIIRIVEDTHSPPLAIPPNQNDILTVIKTDGAYTKCLDQNNETVYISANTDVEIVNP